jgi:hypothetical protein
VSSSTSIRRMRFWLVRLIVDVKPTHPGRPRTCASSGVSQSDVEPRRESMCCGEWPTWMSQTELDAILAAPAMTDERLAIVASLRAGIWHSPLRLFAVGGAPSDVGVRVAALTAPFRSGCAATSVMFGIEGRPLRRQLILHSLVCTYACRAEAPVALLSLSLVHARVFGSALKRAGESALYQYKPSESARRATLHLPTSGNDSDKRLQILPTNAMEEPQFADRRRRPHLAKLQP